jgi:hypothetical protein
MVLMRTVAGLEPELRQEMKRRVHLSRLNSEVKRVAQGL